MPVDIFDDHDCVGSIANGILWVEARDDAKQHTMHRAVPTTRNSPALNGSSAEAEKP